MNTGDRDERLFLYLAGALDGAELDEVEEWIASGAPDVAERLARAEDEVALLAAAQRRFAPSPAVRERLLARARSGAAASRSDRRSGLGRLALAAGIAGVVAAGALGVASWRSGQQAAARVAAVQAELAAARAQLDELRVERDGLDDELADVEARARSLESDLVLADKTIAVLRAEESEALDLVGTEAAPGARGRVFWDWDTWYCYLHVQGLRPDPSPHYAIWLFTEDGMVGVGTFHADAEGKAEFLGPVPHDVGLVLRAVVSIEPDEDLGPKPRGEIVLADGADVAG